MVAGKFIKNIIRKVIIKTNLYWPFSHFNRAIYKLAIKWLIHSYKKSPEIKSIYALGSLATGNYIPGISDVDFMFIIDGKQTLEDEFCVLCSFWKKYYRIYKFFPMFKHFIILNDRYFKTGEELKINNYEWECRRLMYGVETVKVNYASNYKALSIRSVDSAINYYLYAFLPSYRQGPHAYPLLLTLQRLTFKIFTYLNYPDTQDVKNKQAVLMQSGNRQDLLCCIINELEKGIKEIIPLNISVDPKINIDILRDNGSFSGIYSNEKSLDIIKTAPSCEAIESILLTYKKQDDYMIFVVLKDGIDKSMLKACVELIEQTFSHEEKMPIIISFSSFKYLLSFYDPLIYLHSIGKRKVLYGRDLLLDIQPPARQIFVVHLLAKSMELLIYLSDISVVFYWDSEQYLKELWQNIEYRLEAALLARLYLEKGIIKASFNELVSECQKYYPYFSEKISKLKEKLTYDKDGLLNKDGFKLSRSIADDIHKDILNYKSELMHPR